MFTPHHPELLSRVETHQPQEEIEAAALARLWLWPKLLPNNIV